MMSRDTREAPFGALSCAFRVSRLASQSCNEVAR